MRNTFLKLCFYIIPICTNSNLIAQNNDEGHYGQVDLTYGINNSQSNISLDYQFILRTNAGSTRKNRPIILEFGFGGRFTSFFGRNVYFSTVPLYHDKDPSHLDSVMISTPQISALNLLINISFCIKDRLRIGFTGDMIGFSFGSIRSGMYINGSDAKYVAVSPEHFNCFFHGVGSEEQIGSLKTEMFVSYLISGKWSAKVGLQIVTLEYVTDTKIQQYPEPNDRFRNESLLPSIGVVYKIH